MKKYVIILVGLLWYLAASLKSDKNLVFQVPAGWPAPVYDFTKNPLSAAKVLLGRALFYDPVLSADSTISCTSCHLQYTAFTHVDHTLSHGISGSIGTRNAPATMNLAWSKQFMWDGAVNHLDVQPLAPIAHPAEMGSSLDSVIFRLQRSATYKKLFISAFGDSIVTGERLLKSISQFMLTLVSANSKYDLVKNKVSGVAFSLQEEKGYALFREHCASCHTEPLFTTNGFANNGLAVDTTLNDYGRIRITRAAKDSLLFKIPTLRNVEYSYPYMHDGRFKRLQDVINHYASGIVQHKTLSPELMHPIVLSADDKVDLLAFLLTLTDKKFLFNPDYSYPKEIFLYPAKE